MLRLIQLRNGNIRKIGVIDEPRIKLLSEFTSIYELARAAINSRAKISALTNRHNTDESLDYDEVYGGQSEWRILPAADHPEEPSRCLVTGTGLTHMASAKNRDAMHAKNPDQPAQIETLTDSMKMFRWGLEGGRPAPGKIGVAPEWFYKGCGDVLRAHGEPLVTPRYAEDGGEEPVGNEFSDHKFEKRNYLYLAGSKLRNCALGPELIVDHDFQSVPGEVVIERDGRRLWSQEVKTGEAEMCHSLSNIEHHHFKFEWHRRPGDLHVHFFGADAFSFGAGVQLSDGDVMTVSFEGFGRPLRNPVKIDSAADEVVAVARLD
jgi:hypothetical protein